MTDARDIALRELMRQLDEVTAERDAALKLVDDTLEAVGAVDPGEIAHISATERDQLAALDKAVEKQAVDIVVKDWKSPTSQMRSEPLPEMGQPEYAQPKELRAVKPGRDV